jgi:hypothetical protein
MKNFDIIRTSEYVVTESKLVDSFKSKFENYKVEVDPILLVMVMNQL